MDERLEEFRRGVLSDPSNHMLRHSLFQELRRHGHPKDDEWYTRSELVGLNHAQAMTLPVSFKDCEFYDRPSDESLVLAAGYPVRYDRTKGQVSFSTIIANRDFVASQSFKETHTGQMYLALHKQGFYQKVGPVSYSFDWDYDSTRGNLLDVWATIELPTEGVDKLAAFAPRRGPDCEDRALAATEALLAAIQSATPEARFERLLDFVEHWYGRHECYGWPAGLIPERTPEVLARWLRRCGFQEPLYFIQRPVCPLEEEGEGFLCFWSDFNATYIRWVVPLAGSNPKPFVRDGSKAPLIQLPCDLVDFLLAKTVAALRGLRRNTHYRAEARQQGLRLLKERGLPSLTIPTGIKPKEVTLFVGAGFVASDKPQDDQLDVCLGYSEALEGNEWSALRAWL